MTKHGGVGGSRGARAVPHLVLGAVVATAAVLVVGAPSSASVGIDARAVPTSAAVSDGRAALVADLDGLRPAVGDAVALLADSEDRVLDASTRTRLADAVTVAETRIAEGEEALVWPAVVWRAGTWNDVEQALARSSEAVTAEVAAWEAEQARIAAERAAAEAAAAEAARVAAAAGPRAAGVAGPPIEQIWTAGGQAQIDACRGSVDVREIAAYLGGGFYAAEHWGCGGSAWSGRGVGTIVVFPGYGTYRVSGIVGGLVYGVDASALPPGYAGYYQTCVGGSTSNMTVWLLTRA